MYAAAFVLPSGCETRAMSFGMIYGWVEDDTLMYPDTSSAAVDIETNAVNG